MILFYNDKNCSKFYWLPFSSAWPSGRLNILARIWGFFPSSPLIFAAIMGTQQDIFQAIISHAKEYGFVFPSSEIYDGLSAVYDYGPYGSELKRNIRDDWWKSMTQLHENIVGVDAAIFMHPMVWKASGHVDNFSDPVMMKTSKKNMVP